MSTLQLDIGGGGTNPKRFTNNNVAGEEEVAIDYSKSSTNRMSPDDEAQVPARRVPTKGMRKAYPEDQFAKVQSPQFNQFQSNSPHLNTSPSPVSALTNFSLKAMDQLQNQQIQPYYQSYQAHESETPSPYYPTPPPYTDPVSGHYPQQQEHIPQHNRYFEYHEATDDVKEYQCLKCGLFFSSENDLAYHYTHDHQYGQQNMGGSGGGGIGGERSNTSSTNSSGGGGHPSHIPNRYHHNSTTSSRTSATSSGQDMFCDKCQLRFHCQLNYRVHLHEHVLPNVQPHYPMSSSHLLSLSYSCEICGANFMSREALVDHANAHLFEHVCESSCGGEQSNHSATNSSEEFFNYQREQMYQRQNMNQQMQYPQQGYEEVDDLRLTQGPNLYSNQVEYSTPDQQLKTQDFQEQQQEVSKFGESEAFHEPLIVMDNGKRRFQCVVCKKYLSSRIAHEEHYRGKHSGDRPYCCSYCGKRFAVWNTYKHHVGTHKSGLAPPLQRCTLCEKRFKTVECLRSHMQREHNVQNGRDGGGGEGDQSNNGGNGGGYSCQICGKTFVRKMWRTRHYLSHAGQNCLRCELCSCILPDLESYKLHHESHKLSN